LSQQKTAKLNWQKFVVLGLGQQHCKCNNANCSNLHMS